MRNLRRQREEAVGQLSRLIGPLNWQWRMDRYDQLSIFHIDSDWPKGKVVYIPNMIKKIHIKLDMKDRLELHAKCLEEFNLIFKGK